MGVFGNILGGAIADCLAKRLGYHGRPLSVGSSEFCCVGAQQSDRTAEAQISVAIGIPMMYLWFAGISPGSEAAVFGLLPHQLQ